MPTYTPSIAVSTYLQAVNALLVSGGESPVSALVDLRPDLAAAQQLVDECSREVQAEGWTFNTEFGYEVLPSASFSWLSARTGEYVPLNVFVPEGNLLSFSLTEHPTQAHLDLMVRKPRSWDGGGLVFYDRSLNRDGLIDPVIYIDPMWLLEFNDLPQAARTLIYTKAIRRYLAQVVGDATAANQQSGDELVAYRVLKREFGRRDRYNVFSNTGVSQVLGGRPIHLGQVTDPRISDVGVIVAQESTNVFSLDLSVTAAVLDLLSSGSGSGGGTGGSGGGSGGSGGSGGGSTVEVVASLDLEPNTGTIYAAAVTSTTDIVTALTLDYTSAVLDLSYSVFIASGGIAAPSVAAVVVLQTPVVLQTTVDEAVLTVDLDITSGLLGSPADALSTVITLDLSDTSALLDSSVDTVDTVETLDLDVTTGLLDSSANITVVTLDLDAAVATLDTL